MKDKATFPAFCWGDNEAILGMFKAFQKMFNIFLNLTWRYFHLASDIGDSQRIV